LQDDKKLSSTASFLFPFTQSLSNVFVARACEYHKSGDKLKYPEDRGIMCPWLLDSASSMIRVLQYGGNLPWKYEDTPYEKRNDPDGTTTEFVRCPDPTSSGVVLKIIRKKKKEE